MTTTVPTVFVEYVGLKPIKGDNNVAHTGIAWMGKGDVQPVPLAAWGKMAKYPDIWKLVDAPLEAAPPPDPRPFVLKHQDGSELDLSKLEESDLKEFIDKHDLKVDKRKKGDQLREGIVDAVKAATAEA